MVKRSSGFEWRAERPNATTFVEQKWGWTGLAVGELELESVCAAATGLAGSSVCRLHYGSQHYRGRLACLPTSLVP